MLKFLTDLAKMDPHKNQNISKTNRLINKRKNRALDYHYWNTYVKFPYITLKTERIMESESYKLINGEMDNFLLLHSFLSLN